MHLNNFLPRGYLQPSRLARSSLLACTGHMDADQHSGAAAPAMHTRHAPINASADPRPRAAPVAV
jgi:hypothetical protein